VAYLPDRRNVSDGTEGVVKSAQTLHKLHRLRVYSDILTAKVVNNLVILLNCRTEHVFLRAPDNIGRAWDMEMAMSIDTNRPAFLINLEAPVLRFIVPTWVSGAMGVTEGIMRKEMLKRMQTVLQLCQLQMQIPPPGGGLGDCAMASDRYRRVMEQRGMVGNGSREREREGKG
jgi:hypothetical protein